MTHHTYEEVTNKAEIAFNILMAMDRDAISPRQFDFLDNQLEMILTMLDRRRKALDLPHDERRKT